MSELIDITGQRFGKLTVIKRAESYRSRNAMWLCRCDCGNEIIASGSNLRRGDRKSCGCARKRSSVEERYCEYCGAPLSFYNKRFCSYSCAAKGNRGVEQVEVDMSHDWKSAGQGLWICRYRKHIRCKDRNCAKCGWNPEVAEARSRAIMEQRKVATE